MRIIGGMFGMAIGVALLWKTFAIVNFMGKFDWAEQYFSGGFGGTYFFYKLAGLLVVILSALYMFGILDHLLGPVANLFGGLRSQ